MRKVLFFLFITVSFSVFSQNYKLVDRKVNNYPEIYSLKTLAKKINTDFDNDNEKVRAAYYWIATNINYNYEALSLPRIPELLVFTSKKKYEEKLEEKRKRTIDLALTSRKALCNGFSEMFKEICGLLGLEAQVVLGITKVHPNEINSFRTIKDHAWNVVKINGEWELIDITWSTGFLDQDSKKWITDFNDFFFLTKPEQFVTSHFPENKKWQLLEETISIKLFYEKPIFYAYYYDSKVILNSGQKGQLIVKDGKIVLHFDKKGISSNLYYAFSGDSDIKPLIVKKSKDNTYQAIINFKAAKDSTLTVYVNTRPILDFKIN